MRRDILQRCLAAPGPGSSDFDLNRGFGPREDMPFRPAAVMVGIKPDDTVVLTKRSSRLEHHPGQIAFPGGKVEKTDAGVQDAALRETEEEIGVSGSVIDIVGTLPEHKTVTGFRITPVVGLLPQDLHYRPEAGEVEEVFEVPLDHVGDPSRFRVESRMWRGQRRSFYVVPFGPYYIWGATARILRGFAERLSHAAD